MGTHLVEFRKSAKGQKGAFQIKELLHDKKHDAMFTKSKIKASPLGDEITIPDGNLREHLRKQVIALGGEDAYVTLVFHYKPAPGEQVKHGVPPGFKLVSKKL